jgi:glycosyltransferase involved in cell wall biosynthesis
VLLCYGARKALGAVAAPLHGDLERAGVPYELILVANWWEGADDDTPAEAAAFAREHEHVVVVARPKAGAMGFDLRAGLDAARGRYLVYLDGDGQVPTRAAVEAYHRLRETGAAVVKGRRHLREDGSIRTLTSLGFNALFRLLFGTRGVWDVNGQPKGLTRAAYEALDLRTDDWFTDAEIVLKARAGGMTISEFPVRFEARREGVSSNVDAGTVWEFLRNMIRWRLGRHHALPARHRKPRVTARAGR